MSKGGALIGLLRHGEVEGGACYRGSTDDPLSEAGWRQMWASVGDSPDWSRIVSSPLVRCSAFAKAFAERHGKPLRLDARLAEMHFGLWEGLTAAELMEQDADALMRFWKDPVRHPPPEAEPLPAFVERVMSAWSDIATADAPGRTLVVSHGGAIRVILNHLSGQPLTKLLEQRVELGELHCVPARGQ